MLNLRFIRLDISKLSKWFVLRKVNLNLLREGQRFIPYVGSYTSGGGQRLDSVAAFRLITMKFRFDFLVLSTYFALVCSGKCFKLHLIYSPDIDPVNKEAKYGMDGRGLILSGADFFSLGYHVQTSSGAHSTPCPMNMSYWSMKITAHLHLVRRYLRWRLTSISPILLHGEVVIQRGYF